MICFPIQKRRQKLLRLHMKYKTFTSFHSGKDDTVVKHVVVANIYNEINKIVCFIPVFHRMHLVPTKMKHFRWTDRQTMDSDPCLVLCFTGATKICSK